MIKIMSLSAFVSYELCCFIVHVFYCHTQMYILYSFWLSITVFVSCELSVSNICIAPYQFATFNTVSMGFPRIFFYRCVGFYSIWNNKLTERCFIWFLLCDNKAWKRKKAPMREFKMYACYSWQNLWGYCPSSI